MTSVLPTASAAVLLGAILSAPSSAQDCGDPGFGLDLQPPIVEIGTSYDVCISLPPGSWTAYMLLSLEQSITPTQYGPLCVGPPFLAVVGFGLPEGGDLCEPDRFVGCDPAYIGLEVFLQYVAISNDQPGLSGVSNLTSLSIVDGDCNNPCTGTMGDLVWQDLDGDNVQDQGEPGIPGVTVVLSNDAGEILDTTTTDANGHYLFENHCAGTYSISIDLDSVPGGLAPVLADIGTDDALDSDSSPALVVLTDDVSVDLDTDFGFGDCGECDGKISGLSLVYEGADPIPLTIVQDKDDLVVFDGAVATGDAFTILALGSAMNFGKKLEFFVAGDEVLEIHTSCSQPIGPGMTFGDFRVVAGASLDGGLLCVQPDTSDEVCFDGGKPQSLTMVYTGESCAASDNQQSGDKFTCDGDPGFASPVHIVAYKSDDVWFEGDVALGESFLIDATLAGETRLKGETLVDIYDANGVLLQAINFHTSCSQPLFVGDQFGSLLLTDFTLE